MFQGILQIAIALLMLLVTAPLLGRYMARVFMGQSTLLDPIARPFERLLFASGGFSNQSFMTSSQYVRAILVSNLVMGVLVFLIFMLQGMLPLNPVNLNAPDWDLALHTAISFVTNTNQQHYSGEVTYSYFSQVGALGFLMFTSAATGLAVAIAFIRGLTGNPLGNFYVDLTVSITRILLPISMVGAIALLIAGVPETFAGPAVAQTLEGATQYIARGPVAHFEIIKQLGENGGGFFGVNSAHPFENPNSFTNLLETLIMVIIPAGLILTYGIMAGRPRQGWLIFGMVFVFYAVMNGVAAYGEYAGNPLVNDLLGYQAPNLEGKDVRFGWALTALWAVTTTGTMCGAVNGMHDSLMPTGGFTTLSDLFLQIIWGGQGTGTAYLFVFLILTVFLTGLMVGRTPEFFNRKIEQREIVLASIILLVHPIAILIPGAITLAFPEIVGAPDINTLAGITNPGYHGISQVIYEYASAAANNGSGFEGLLDDTPWWNLSTSFSLLLGRYVPIAALVYLADSMAHKQPVPETTGTLYTDTLLFTGITTGVIVVLGALTFLPVLALGPVAEGFAIARAAAGG